MKQYLLKTNLGHIMLAARDKVELLSAAFGNPESVGTLANDQLATYLVTRLCRKGKVFIDVGAHIGSILSEVRRNCASVEIFAIEAIPGKADNIRNSFKDITVYNCAVGDHEGGVTFYENTQKSGYSSLIKPSTADFIKELTVPLRKMDDLISHEGVDVIKIDVEGAELSVLQGSNNIIKTSNPVILFESAPGEEGIKEELWNYFQRHDYILLAPNRLAHNDPGLGLETFLEGHLYPRRTTNYFAVPRERHIETRNLARELLNIHTK